jgi:hypothetical protein
MQELSELRTSSEAHFRTVENKFMDLTGSITRSITNYDLIQQQIMSLEENLFLLTMVKKILPVGFT